MQERSLPGEVAHDAATVNVGQAQLANKQDLARTLSSNSTTGVDTGAGPWAQLSSNPFFTAGFGLAALGFAGRYAAQGVRRSADLIRRRLLVDVEINIKDPIYDTFLLWMTQHERRQLAGELVGSTAKGNIGFVQAVVHRLMPRMRQLAIETKVVDLPNGAKQTHYALVPGPGRHFVRYGNAIIHVNRQREGNRLDHSTGKPWETTTLTTLYSQRHVFEQIFKEAHGIAQKSSEGKTRIWITHGQSWEPFGEPRQKRPINSIILEKDVKERIVADVQDFIASSEWYRDRGIPYRRGYLLYGPPGTGKSSFIQALAGHLDYDIAIINLSERGMNDDRFNKLLSTLPGRTLALLEDVDAAFVNRQQKESDGYSGATVTFSGLLNALDGVASAEERILFCTTNHIELLDEALVRPGRVDMTVRIGHATAYQIRNLWDRFYEEMDPEGTKKTMFVTRLVEAGVLSGIEDDASSTVSTAALQGLFVYNKGNPDGATGMAWQLASGSMPSEMVQREQPQ